MIAGVVGLSCAPAANHGATSAEAVFGRALVGVVRHASAATAYKVGGRDVDAPYGLVFKQRVTVRGPDLTASQLADLKEVLLSSGPYGAPTATMLWGLGFRLAAGDTVIWAAAGHMQLIALGNRGETPRLAAAPGAEKRLRRLAGELFPDDPF